MSCCPTDKTSVCSSYISATVPSYEVGNATSKRALIFIYDIFGLSPQVRKVADQMSAKLDCRVIVPDVLDGDAIKQSEFPPADWTAFHAWVSKWNSDVLAKSLLPFVEKLRAQGVEKIGFVGYCWGARICKNFYNDGFADYIALVHPSFLDDKDFVEEELAASKGIAILRTKSDPVMLETKAKYAAAAKPNFVFADFNTMEHGFMGARGDFNDPETAAELARGIEILTKFFNATLQ